MGKLVRFWTGSHFLALSWTLASGGRQLPLLIWLNSTLLDITFETKRHSFSSMVFSLKDTAEMFICFCNHRSLDITDK